MTDIAEHSRLRPLFIAALVAGVAYFALVLTIVSAPWMPAVKGLGVGLLAIWAALNARNLEGWWIAAVLALGAAGDVLIDSAGLIAGAALFLAGHLLAIGLYQRHRRSHRSPTQVTLAVVLLIATPLVAWSFTHAIGVLAYAAGLGAMAASAWLSRFPRYRVGLGAVLFVISDLTIFAEMGPLGAGLIARLIIWPTYFAAQALIAWGVVSTLSRWKADHDLHHRL